MPTFIKSNVDATVNVNSEAIQSADYNYSDEALTLTFTMQRLASIIVDKIFERQDELDEELMAEWQLEILEQTELPNERDELNRLEEMLTKAISEDEFELAATLHKKIIKIKTK